MTNVIEAHDLGFRSGNRYILQNINWQVAEGEHWIVFGLNGSGKTTLLSILSGYQANTHGSIKVFGKELSAQNVLAIRANMGFVSSSFFDHYYTKEVALEIVLSGKFATLGLNLGITDQEIVQAKHLMCELGLERKMHYPFNILSKGERQCVLLARALFNRPRILLLDEPCSGLDILASSRFYEALNAFTENRTLTILFVTHTLESILPSFDKCLLLDKGKVAFAGLARDILTSENLSKVLRSPIDIVYENNHYRSIAKVSSGLLNWYQDKDAATLQTY